MRAGLYSTVNIFINFHNPQIFWKRSVHFLGSIIHGYATYRYLCLLIWRSWKFLNAGLFNVLYEKLLRTIFYLFFMFTYIKILRQKHGIS